MIGKYKDKGDTIRRWSDELEKRWKESKYYQLWITEIKARRDPRNAFEKRGWIS